MTSHAIAAICESPPSSLPLLSLSRSCSPLSTTPSAALVIRPSRISSARAPHSNSLPSTAASSSTPSSSSINKRSSRISVASTTAVPGIGVATNSREINQSSSSMTDLSTFAFEHIRRNTAVRKCSASFSVVVSLHSTSVTSQIVSRTFGLARSSPSVLSANATSSAAASCRARSRGSWFGSSTSSTKSRIIFKASMAVCAIASPLSSSSSRTVFSRNDASVYTRLASTSQRLGVVAPALWTSPLCGCGRCACSLKTVRQAMLTMPTVPTASIVPG
mmetsp:Transcript_28501/g.85438  ORF Transcript_28501/g.85438 Transcript_28501/m.85438 type:complete len:276 (-) Transcript_28501:505-1332(-)